MCAQYSNKTVHPRVQEIVCDGMQWQRSRVRCVTQDFSISCSNVAILAHPASALVQAKDTVKRHHVVFSC